MKKTLAVILAITVVTLVFASCGSQSQGGSSPAPYYTQAQSSETAEPALSDNFSNVLSSDYHSGQFQVDGVVYTLPVKGSEFLSHGWEHADSYAIGEMCDPDDDTFARLFNGKQYVGAYFYNYSDQPLTIENCYLYEIFIYNTESNPDGTDVLPGGLNISTTKYQDFIDKWGTPSYDGIAEGNGDNIIHYEIGNYEKDYKYFISLKDDLSIESVGIINKNKPANIDIDETTTIV